MKAISVFDRGLIPQTILTWPGTDYPGLFKNFIMTGTIKLDFPSDLPRGGKWYYMGTEDNDKILSQTFDLIGDNPEVDLSKLPEGLNRFKYVPYDLPEDDPFHMFFLLPIMVYK